MNVGSLIRRLAWVSVVVAVVSLPRILAGPFLLPSSGVAGDPMSEVAERPGVGRRPSSIASSRSPTIGSRAHRRAGNSSMADPGLE